MSFKESWILVLSGIVAWLVAVVVDAFLLTGPQWSVLITYSINGVLWLTSAMVVYSQRKLALGFCAIGLCLALYLALLPSTVLAPILIVLWVSLLPNLLMVKYVWSIFIVFNTLFLILVAGLKPGTESFITSVSFVAFQLFGISSSILQHNLSKQKLALEKAHFELIATQNLLEQKSASEERMRISRDLHDNLGQRMTALSLSVEYAIHQPPNDFTEFATNLKQGLSDTLSDLRATVGEFRDIQQLDLIDTIKKLISQVPQLTLTIDDQINIESNSLKEQLVYCLQEGISNALRHGNATKLELVTFYDKDNVVFQLKDNGSKKYPTRLEIGSGGNGLKGMRERLDNFKGLIALLDNHETGKTLQLTIPKKYCKESIS